MIPDLQYKTSHVKDPDYIKAGKPWAQLPDFKIAAKYILCTGIQEQGKKLIQASDMCLQEN